MATRKKRAPKKAPAKKEAPSVSASGAVEPLATDEPLAADAAPPEEAPIEEAPIDPARRRRLDKVHPHVPARCPVTGRDLDTTATTLPIDRPVKLTHGWGSVLGRYLLGLEVSANELHAAADYLARLRADYEASAGASETERGAA